MASEPAVDSFPLLELPGQLRNMIYEHVLFASAWTIDISQRQANLNDGVKIHTNILLTSRKVFEEARNVIIGAQLVQVISHGVKPRNQGSTAAIEDGIPLFHTRYRKFCLLKHIMDQDYASIGWHKNEDISYVIRKEDVFQFCGGISGLDPDRYVPQILSPRISHNLILLDPEARLPPAPAHVSIRVPTHKRLLQVYQSVLAGCRDMWVSAHESMEPDDNFMKEMENKIMFSNISRISSLENTNTGEYYENGLWTIGN